MKKYNEMNGATMSTLESEELRRKLTNKVYAMALVGPRPPILELDEIMEANTKELAEIAKRYR